VQQQLASLYNQVVGVGSGKSLADKVTLIQGYVEVGNKAEACGTLGAFINEVTTQSARIGPTLAAQLITQAMNIQTGLGC
jgi:hypothetical protein